MTLMMPTAYSEKTGRPRRDTQVSTANSTISIIAKEHDVNENEAQKQKREAWLTALGSFLIYYSSLGLLNTFGFFQEYYENQFLKNLPVSPSTISFIGTLQIALSNSLAAVSGALCDFYGVKYLYMASGISLATSFIGLSFSKPLITHLFLSQGLFMGTAIAFGAQPAFTAVTQHYNEKRGLAMTIVYTGSAIGGLCFHLMFTTLTPRIGFPWTMRITALKILVLFR
ncbi:unnamed protein product [Periconia digitata]|uniref:Major facilitator superfamily (MFS) profile domain-containing protein n=1 Tax=Periconia digitata TaxID=1303443 RepID=A0A9W4XSP0_9PLEO|nr:unnamed protein product [Periconia digitata]